MPVVFLCCVELLCSRPGSFTCDLIRMAALKGNTLNQRLQTQQYICHAAFKGHGNLMRFLHIVKQRWTTFYARITYLCLLINSERFLLYLREILLLNVQLFSISLEQCLEFALVGEIKVPLQLQLIKFNLFLPFKVAGFSCCREIFCEYLNSSNKFTPCSFIVSSD